jgi:hypothetical protein
MADFSAQNLNADKGTQALSGASTIERFDYKLQSTDFASVSKFAEFSHTWEQNSRSIETCITKLNALKSKDASHEDIDNCFKKLKAVNALFHN